MKPKKQNKTKKKKKEMKIVKSHYSRFKFVEPKHCSAFYPVGFLKGIVKGVSQSEQWWSHNVDFVRNSKH